MSMGQKVAAHTLEKLKLSGALETSYFITCLSFFFVPPSPSDPFPPKCRSVYYLSPIKRDEKQGMGVGRVL